jgi:hypothetical protein
MNKIGDYSKLSSRELDKAVHTRVIGQPTLKLAAATADGGKSYACVESVNAGLFNSGIQRKHVELFCCEHAGYSLVDYEYCPQYSQSLTVCWCAVMAMATLESEGKLGAYWHNQWSGLTPCRATRDKDAKIALCTPDSTHIRHAKEEHVARYLCERMLEALDVGNPSMSEVLDSFKELGKGVDWERFDKEEREDEIAELKANIEGAQKRLAELEAESRTSNPEPQSSA